MQASTLEAAIEVIDWYRARWEIELFFLVLKDGCRVERLQLADTVLFETDEWRAAFILNKKPVPKQVPTLNTVVRLIAQRGGFLGRKHDGEPGAKTVWLGMQEIAVFIAGTRCARQLGKE